MVCERAAFHYHPGRKARKDVCVHAMSQDPQQGHNEGLNAFRQFKSTSVNPLECALPHSARH
jgi:hypothetical protein